MFLLFRAFKHFSTNIYSVIFAPEDPDHHEVFPLNIVFNKDGKLLSFKCRNSKAEPLKAKDMSIQMGVEIIKRKCIKSYIQLTDISVLPFTHT